jgi:aminoglycoside phosphotransferase (APT) family kinase protein
MHHGDGAVAADASLLEAMRRMRLVGAGEVPPMEILSGGVSSRIVVVDTAQGRLCVKRALPQLAVAAQWFAPVERSDAEVAWLRRAAQIDRRCVPNLLGHDARSHTFAMSFLPPQDYPVWKTLLRDGVVRREFAAAVGACLSTLHAAWAGRDDIAREFADDAAFHALRIEPYLLATARIRLACRRQLEAFAQEQMHTRLTLIHGDVSPKNILAGPEGPVFLDAESATYGDPAFDLAFCLNHLLLKCCWQPAHTAGYVACFEALVAAYWVNVSWEAPEGLERRAAALLPALMLARIDGKSPVEYLVDESSRRFVREFAAARLTAPPASLAQLVADWRRDLAV